MDQILFIFNLIKIKSFDPLPSISTQGSIETPYKVKSGDLSIIHDNKVMQRHKLSSDWTHVTEQISLDHCVANV